MFKVRFALVAALLDQMIVSATSFAVTVMIGRYIGSESLGVYTLGFSLVVLLAGVQSSLVSMPWTVIRSSLGDGYDRKQQAGSTLLLSLWLSLITVLLGLTLFCVLGFSSTSAGLVELVCVIVVTMPFFLLREFARRFDFAELSMVSAFWLDLAVSCIQLSGLGWLIATDRLTTAAAFAVNGLACLIPLLIWAGFRFRGSFVFRFSATVPYAHKSFVLGRWIFGDTMAWTCNFYALHWMLFYLMTATETGIYAACMSIAALTSPIHQGIGNYLSPRIAKDIADGNISSTQRLVGHAGFYIFTCMIGFSACMFVTGGYLISLLYKDPLFSEYGYIVGIHALRVTTIATKVPYVHALFAMQRPRAATLSSFAGLAATIILAGPLTYLFGLTGAAVAGLVGSTFELGLTIQSVQSNFVQRGNSSRIIESSVSGEAMRKPS